MCLERINKRFKQPTTRVQNAWKVIEMVDGEPYSCFRSTKIPTSKWIKAEHIDVHTENYSARFAGLSYDRQLADRELYVSGFHVIATKKEADSWLAYMQRSVYRQSWKVIPVKVRGITVIGPDASDDEPIFIEAHYRTFVANEMFISKKSLI